MRLRFTIYPPGKVEYHCELNVREEDLGLDAQAFAEKYLTPCAGVLLSPFEEPWPEDPMKALEMLNRGGPERGICFYRTHH